MAPTCAAEGGAPPPPATPPPPWLNRGIAGWLPPVPLLLLLFVAVGPVVALRDPGLPVAAAAEAAPGGGLSQLGPKLARTRPPP